MQMRMAKQYTPELPIEQTKYRFPDVLPRRAKKKTHGVTPPMAMIAMYYRKGESIIRHNVRLNCADMSRKGYPAKWRRPLLYHRMSQRGAWPEVLSISRGRTCVDRICFHEVRINSYLLSPLQPPTGAVNGDHIDFGSSVHRTVIRACFVSDAAF